MDYERELNKETRMYTQKCFQIFVYPRGMKLNFRRCPFILIYLTCADHIMLNSCSV